jgi:hypothetical protein
MLLKSCRVPWALVLELDHALPVFGKAYCGSMLFFPEDKKFYTLLTTLVCWSIWIISKKTFDKYVLRSHAVIIFTLCSFIKCWARLGRGEDGLGGTTLLVNNRVGCSLSVLLWCVGYIPQ